MVPQGMISIEHVIYTTLRNKIGRISCHSTFGITLLKNEEHIPKWKNIKKKKEIPLIFQNNLLTRERGVV